MNIKKGQLWRMSIDEKKDEKKKHYPSLKLELPALQKMIHF